MKRLSSNLPPYPPRPECRVPQAGGPRLRHSRQTRRQAHECGVVMLEARRGPRSQLHYTAGRVTSANGAGEEHHGQNAHRPQRASEGQIFYQPHFAGQEYLQLCGRLHGVPRRVLEPKMDEFPRAFSTPDGPAALSMEPLTDWPAEARPPPTSQPRGGLQPASAGFSPAVMPQKGRLVIAWARARRCLWLRECASERPFSRPSAWRGQPAQ